jgi:hypothetical protein
MATTHIWRASRVPVLARRGSTARDGSGGPGRRAGVRLWALLHAQGLINGAAVSRDDVTLVEDDRGRMSGWRRN